MISVPLMDIRCNGWSFTFLMGVGVLFDLVNFSGNIFCFHLVSKFHNVYFLHPSFYQNSLLMKRQNGNIS